MVLGEKSHYNRVRLMPDGGPFVVGHLIINMYYSNNATANSGYNDLD